MDTYNWSHFTTRIAVSAPVEKLYWCWATKAGMEHWFLRLSEFKNKNGVLRSDNEFIQAGDTYRWRWHGWEDGVTEEDSILAANGKDMISFGFGKAGNCTVHIKEESGKNLVELVQENVPDDDAGRHTWHLGCKTGWTFYLANMKSLLEGGIDLRNRDVNLKNVVNS
jgi:uncharacterized protein YndB with AHSA1/START domain